MTKTRDLRPCDCCGGPIFPTFYRINLNIRQMIVDHRVVNQVVGTALLLGSFELGEIMSPNSDAAIEVPDSGADKELFICQECIFGLRNSLFSIIPRDLIVEGEQKGTDHP